MTASLVNHLWQSTLVAGLAWLVTIALRRDRAGVRYGVWLAASLKFLVPLTALTAVGARFGWRPVVLASFVPNGAMIDSTGPMAERAVRLWVGPASSMSPTISPLHQIADVLPEVLLAVWAVGAMALLAVWLVRWRRVASVVRASRPLHEGPVFDALGQLEARVGIQRPIALVVSQSSLEPGIFGMLSPTLVWPARIDEHLSLAQITAIVAHEVTHVRRRDNLAAGAHMAVQAAFWFHPMVWWMGSRLVHERELACDEDVVRLLGHDREVYAESILKTCQFSIESPVPCVAGVTGSDLKRRIEYIMTNEIRPALNAWKKSMLALAGVAAIAVPFVAGIMTVNAQQIGVSGAAPAAATGTGAAFDVTSVKPNNSGSGMVRMMPAANGGFQAENVTLGMLVRLSNQLQDNQIVGGPKWLFEERFDIVGTGTAPGKDGQPMEKMKSLLVDRFKLVTHIEKREQSMYALVLARKDGKLGDKMTPSTADCTSQGPNGRGAAAPPAPGERPRCGFMIAPGRLVVGGQTMAAFATNLSRFAGGIVVDKTGLTGTYDIELSYAPDPGISPTGRDLPGGGPPPPPVSSDAPSIYAAVQEQLGLKLDATKGQVDVLVIDSAEKPTQD